MVLFSCKKEIVYEIHIHGNVTNVVNGNPMAGVKLKLIRQPIRINQSISGNIVRSFQTDAYGNFYITESLSDKFIYTIRLEDDSVWNQYPNIDMYTSEEIDLNLPDQNFDFKSAYKSFLRLNFVSHNGTSLQDTLQISHFSSVTGLPIYQPYLYITDMVNYQPNSNLTLIQGPSHTNFIFTKRGQDSSFTRYYNLTPGEHQVIDIDLY